MARLSKGRVVNSLEKSPGRRRFVFKPVTQQIEEIEINVFRSLDRINSQPSEGFSFLRDCLVEWRELNMAEDFISIYHEMLPIVQTLPLILISKESIISILLSRLKMEARLSLEHFLRLIAAFSRDILEDFLSFIPRVVNSFVTLLESDSDQDPEIIEQVKWLTKKLRYYHKKYVQELMEMTTSFLLRNASDKQLQRDDLKNLAQEVCGSIRNTLGLQNFVQVYSTIRKTLELKRDKRKQEEKIIAIVNPERNAKRKLRAAEKHRDQEKRKIMTMKFGRVMPCGS